MKSLRTLIPTLLIFLSAGPALTYVSAQAISAQILSATATAGPGCDPIFVQVQFATYGILTVWVGLSFKDMFGHITDVPPEQISVVSADGVNGMGNAYFNVNVNNLPTSDIDIIINALESNNLQYTVAVWQGYDVSTNLMQGELARWGWALVGACSP